MGMDTGHGGGRRESGALESQVLGVLWASDQAMTGADVHTALRAPELSYKTILTVLTRLQAKGRLTREKAGRAFTYRPVPDGSATAAQRMARVLARGADRSAVLQGFLEAIAPADEDLLRSLLSAPRDPGDRT